MKQAFVEEAKQVVKRKRGGAAAGAAAGAGTGGKARSMLPLSSLSSSSSAMAVGVSSVEGGGGGRVGSAVEVALSGAEVEEMFGGWGKPQALEDLAKVGR